LSPRSHELRSREESDKNLGDLLAAVRERLQSVEVKLDRCWELPRPALLGGGERILTIRRTATSQAVARFLR
jgi:hypothetical protein